MATTIVAKTHVAFIVAGICVALLFVLPARIPLNACGTANEVCTLADYTDGEWQPAFGPQVYRGYQYCRIDARQDCRSFSRLNTTDYLSWQWVPRKKHCALSLPTASQIKQCLSNQSPLFLGDSLSRNQQQSLQCMLLEEPESAQLSGGF